MNHRSRGGAFYVRECLKSCAIKRSAYKRNVLAKSLAAHELQPEALQVNGRLTKYTRGMLSAPGAEFSTDSYTNFSPDRYLTAILGCVHCAQSIPNFVQFGKGAGSIFDLAQDAEIRPCAKRHFHNPWPAFPFRKPDYKIRFCDRREIWNLGNRSADSRGMPSKNEHQLRTIHNGGPNMNPKRTHS